MKAEIYIAIWALLSVVIGLLLPVTKASTDSPNPETRMKDDELPYRATLKYAKLVPYYDAEDDIG